MHTECSTALYTISLNNDETIKSNHVSNFFK